MLYLERRPIPPRSLHPILLVRLGPHSANDFHAFSSLSPTHDSPTFH